MRSVTSPSQRSLMPVPTRQSKRPRAPSHITAQPDACAHASKQAPTHTVAHHCAARCLCPRVKASAHAHRRTSLRSPMPVPTRQSKRPRTPSHITAQSDAYAHASKQAPTHTVAHHCAVQCLCPRSKAYLECSFIA
jgi:hypothetical protein